MFLKNIWKLKIKWEIDSSLTITNMLLQKRCFRTSIIRDDLMFYFCTTFPIFLLFAGGPKSRQTKLGAFEWRTSRFNHCWRFRKQSQTQTSKGSWWSQETAHCSKYFFFCISTFPSFSYDFFPISNFTISVRGRRWIKETPAYGACHNQRYLQRLSEQKFLT